MADEHVPIWDDDEGTGRNDWPKSDFSGQKAVLLYEEGSIVYTWLGMGIDDVLRSPTPPELIMRMDLSEEGMDEMLSLSPEIAERFIDALDHGISGGRLLEAVIVDKEFNMDEAIQTIINPEIDDETENPD